MKTDPSKYLPSSTSTAEEWITWHKQLKKWFSKQEANAYFVRFWNQRAGASSSADTHTIRDYMRTQGVDLTTDWGGTFSDASHSVMDWFVTGMNWTRGIVIGVTLLVVGISTYYLITQIKKGKTIGDATNTIAGLKSGTKLLR